ncbi:MAG TPA: copper amine oxidase N-terminal domain-containing protein, partial [Candidatus Butyricicoccus avicola]|nr:copper amine oxidase N-terminal domain-containing protein [Candidatus Butyricicoccus avicola]
MKWKTGVALMVVVLLVAMIPAAVSAIFAGGLPSFAPKPDSHQLVLQIDNSAALRDGEAITMDDGKGNAIGPYIDDNGNMLVPIRPLVEGLGGSLVFEDETFKITIGSDTLELGQNAYSIEGVDGESHTLPVKPTRTGNSFYVPGRAVTEALGGQIAYYPPAEGGYVICTIGDLEDGQIDSLKAAAQEKLGYSVQQ